MDKETLAKKLSTAREVRRCVEGFEFRDEGDALHLRGYASVTETPYDMGYYKETVKRGAFKKTLSENPDVQLLVSHEGLPLARTLSGTMQLEEDHRGLHVQARLDPADPDVQKLVPKMQRGDVNQMSFAFRAIQQNWDEDYTDRKLLEVSLDRGDVSVVGSGANPSTSVNVREFAAALQEVRSGATLSAATKDVLVQALQLFRDADSSTTDGQEIMSELLGVPNPDPDKEKIAELEAQIKKLTGKEPEEEKKSHYFGLTPGQAKAMLLSLNR